MIRHTFELPDSSFFKFARSSSTEELSSNANCNFDVGLEMVRNPVSEEKPSKASKTDWYLYGDGNLENGLKLLIDNV